MDGNIISMIFHFDFDMGREGGPWRKTILMMFTQFVCACQRGRMYLIPSPSLLVTLCALWRLIENFSLCPTEYFSWWHYRCCSTKGFFATATSSQCLYSFFLPFIRPDFSSMTLSQRTFSANIAKRLRASWFLWGNFDLAAEAAEAEIFH